MQGDAAIAIFLEILADLFVQKSIAIHSASETSESLPLLFLTNKKNTCVLLSRKSDVTPDQ